MGSHPPPPTRTKRGGAYWRARRSARWGSRARAAAAPPTPWGGRKNAGSEDRHSVTAWPLRATCHSPHRRRSIRSRRTASPSSRRVATAKARDASKHSRSRILSQRRAVSHRATQAVNCWGAGYWAGACSVLYVEATHKWYLYYRIRGTQPPSLSTAPPHPFYCQLHRLAISSEI